MAYMPAVTAIEIRDPVAVLIEMKTGDRTLHSMPTEPVLESLAPSSVEGHHLDMVRCSAT